MGQTITDQGWMDEWFMKYIIICTVSRKLDKWQHTGEAAKPVVWINIPDTFFLLLQQE